MAADSGVGSVVIVVVQPGLVGGGAFGLAGVGLRVDPFGGEGVVEAFDFPAGLRPVGFGLFVLHALAECVREGV